MRIRDLFDVYSRRQTQSPQPDAALPAEFRNRVVMRCLDIFGHAEQGRNHKHFWDEIYERLRYLMGRPQLIEGKYMATVMQDVTTFLSQCDTKHFLSFIEYIFKTDEYRTFQQNENFLVEEINELLLLDDLPYAVTPFVRETQQQFLYGREACASVIASYPKVIRRDDQVTHAWAVEPALTLLRDKQFTSANKEFVEALEDYRKHDYGDCLTKCGSAFESTMKIICHRKGWPYSQKDTAWPLIQVILEHSSLDTYFEQPLFIVATLRNRLSKSHGSGVEQRNIPEHIAKYAINATAAALLLLVEECT